ncbi:MAG: SIS domain-containing protein [Rhodoferax sp.]|nr:SIS domain-containing protein [Rhodoferax sp.]
MIDYSDRLRALVSEPSRDSAGDSHRLARVERTRVEMMQQGQAIARTLAMEQPALELIARQLQLRAIRHVVVAGCGDSWHVGAGVRHAWQSLTGCPLEAVQALDYGSYGAAAAGRHTLVVGISAGGSTPAVLSALRAGRQRGAFTLGVSNSPASRILTEFDAALVVRASRSGWPTQSSTAAMALLIRLAQTCADSAHARALGAELDAIPSLIDDLLPSADAALAPIAAEIARSRLLLFAGLGPNYASAAFGAAKIRELSPVHAIALQLEEYHHYRTQKQGDPLVLVATDPASHERALDTALVGQAAGGWTMAVLAEDLPEIEARVRHVLRVPAVRPELAALVASVPLHLLAYHFAKARDALGLGYGGAAGSPPGKG